MRYLILMILGLSIVGCSSSESTVMQQDSAVIENRWYTLEQVNAGKELFASQCAVCHGKEAQGTILPWNKVLDNGKYPPPPLNGSAHTWHHPLDVLRFTINEGGKAMGGAMPSFKAQLNMQEVDSIIAFVQNYWTKAIYDQWLKISGLEKKANQ